MDKVQKLGESTAKKEDKPWWEIDLSDEGSDALASNGFPPSAKPNTDQSAVSTNHEISSNSDGKTKGDTTAEECTPGRVDLSDEGSDALASNGFPPSAKPYTDQSAVSTNLEISSNADRKSSGPRTQQGKEKSKHNALKHGIFSKVVLLEWEPRAEFDSLRNGLRDDLEPEGTLEDLLVDKLVALVWRHRRLIVTEGAVIQQGTESLDAKQGAPVQKKAGPTVSEIRLGHFEALRCQIERDGFHKQADESILLRCKAYCGVDPAVERKLLDLYSYCLNSSRSNASVGASKGLSSPRECVDTFLGALNQEIDYLKFSKNERSRMNVELLRGNIMYAQLDRLLRYESNFERAFDRILDQLERLQRIRKGQPVPPTHTVHVTT
jgi:hypothetical protein